MFPTCLPQSGSLPASKTHARRGWSWVPSTNPTLPAIGTLTITQGRRDLDSYGVDVETLGGGFEQVLFCNADGGEVYGVVVQASTGRVMKCTCKGFGFTGHCKHADATVALSEADVLPFPVPATTGCP